MTAVEWLEDHLELVLSGHIKIESIIKQAKKIEKQQIINTWYDCKLSIIEKNPTDADQYFNETFEK